MTELKEIIEDIPVPNFHLNNPDDIRGSPEVKNIKNLVERIARSIYINLDENHIFEGHGIDNPYYNHYVQSGHCPNGKVEYFIITVDKENKEVFKLLEDHFDNPTDSPIQITHLDGIGVDIKYTKKLEDGAIEYVGIGKPHATTDGKVMHIIFAYVPGKFVKNINNPKKKPI